MPERIDRRIGDNSILSALVLIMVFIAASAGTYAWMRMSEQSPLPAVQARPGIPIQSFRVADRVTITLLLPGDDGALSPESMSLSPGIDVQTQAKEALTAAFADQRVLQVPVLGRLKLRAFFIDQSGTAYVDLSHAVEGGIKASAREELLAIYAIVNTLTRNFGEIRQVTFLIDGREAASLAGHMGLSGKFTRRIDLEKSSQRSSS